MARLTLLKARYVKWHTLVPSLSASVLLLAAAISPAAVAAPSKQVRDVARRDTLIVPGFGPGDSEITDPGNMNPYSLGGTWPRSRHPEQDHL